MTKVQTQARAAGVAALAQQDDVFKGFDYAALIAVLIELVPIIVSCFEPTDGPSTQREIEKQWDAEHAGNQYGGYDRSLAVRVQQNALTAARRKRLSLTRAQALALAVRTLDDIRLGDTEQTSLIVREQLDWVM